MIVSLFVLTLFSGCHFKNDWWEATCVEPKTCMNGGETEGEPLGHDWVDATCETPRTCRKCGEEEGEALGHDWIEANCDTPKTCRRCGAVDGEAKGHDFENATTENPKTCKVCGKTEGEPVRVEIYDLNKYYDGCNRGAFNEELLTLSRSVHEGNQEIVEILDAINGEVISTVPVDTSKYDGSFKGWGSNQPFACMVFPCKAGSPVSRIVVVGWDGKIVIDGDLPINILDPETHTSKADWVCTDDVNIKGIIDTNNSLLCYIDLKNGKILDPSELDLQIRGKKDTPQVGEKYGEEYDKSKWSFHSWQPGISGYLVCKTDGDTWGYVDENDKEIVMYRDATDFNEAGYAVVSDDRNIYYIIDTDFKKVGVIEGDGYTSTGMCGGNLFSISRSDGSSLEIVIK